MKELMSHEEFKTVAGNSGSRLRLMDQHVLCECNGLRFRLRTAMSLSLTATRNVTNTDVYMK